MCFYIVDKLGDFHFAKVRLANFKYVKLRLELDRSSKHFPQFSTKGFLSTKPLHYKKSKSIVDDCVSWQWGDGRLAGVERLVIDLPQSLGREKVSS